jgi:hypothetical protein
VSAVGKRPRPVEQSAWNVRTDCFAASGLVPTKLLREVITYGCVFTSQVNNVNA